MGFSINKIFQFTRHYKQDILIAAILGLIFSCVSYHNAKQVPAVVFEGKYLDIWFESDSPRVYKNMILHDSDYSRAKVHPLFALVAYPQVYVVKKVFGCDPLTAVRLVISSVGFFWIMAFFALLRMMKCQRFDSVLLSLLATESAGAVFFFAIPETYPFGSLSLLLAFLILAISQKQVLSPLWYVLVNIATLSITTSNWMLGILVTMINHRFWRTVMIVSAGFVLTVAFWGLEKLFFRRQVFF